MVCEFGVSHHRIEGSIVMKGQGAGKAWACELFLKASFRDVESSGELRGNVRRNGWDYVPVCDVVDVVHSVYRIRRAWQRQIRLLLVDK